MRHLERLDSVIIPGRAIAGLVSTPTSYRRPSVSTSALNGPACVSTYLFRRALGASSAQARAGAKSMPACRAAQAAALGGGIASRPALLRPPAKRAQSTSASWVSRRGACLTHLETGVAVARALRFIGVSVM